MTDPLEILREPVTPVAPDPVFAARLWGRLTRAVLDPIGGGTMPQTIPGATAAGQAPAGRVQAGRASAEPADVAGLARPPALTPYIVVRDGRRAIAWYGEVFGARPRGAPYVMPDGSIGHAELGVGDAVLMLAEGSPQVPVAPPRAGEPFSHTLHLTVDDVDATVERARAAGAEVEREPRDEPYGRGAVLVDPFGHRWMLMRPPGRVTRARHGEVGYVTMVVPDDARARAFYGAVLGWRFTPGGSEHGWNVEDVHPMVGIWGSGEGPAVQPCYRVADIAVATAAVAEHGGRAGEVQDMPYGLLAECVDDQGGVFQLWQPGY